MIHPAYANLTVLQGATFDQTVTIEVDGSAYNMTGFTGALAATAYGETVATITMSTDDGIILGNGTMALSMTGTETAALTAGRYRYQVEVTTGGTTVRVLEGRMNVVPEITPL